MKFIITGVDVEKSHLHYRHNQHYGISRVCGHFEGDDVCQELSAQALVQMIDDAKVSFVTHVKGEPEASVEVVNGDHGPYVRTKADDSERDNLLNLSSCRDAEMVLNASKMLRFMGGR